MAIADDISVSISGNFRWTGAAATTYTVLAFHRYIGALMDDAQASGDDLLDITSETASDRSTDQIITLNSPYNIDDSLAEHLFDGSITQDSGNTVYSGLSVVGSVVSGTEPMIIQDNKILPAYWGTGINVDATSLIIMKIMVKSREGGADIDGKKILLAARELGDQFKEFPVTLGLANSVGAISNQADLNNASSEATIEAFSVSNTEGYQELDIDGTGTTGQEFYSQWDGPASLNDTYEYTKWIGQRSHSADLNTDTGIDFVVDNATITGQAQEFTANTQDEILTEMRFRLKVGVGVPLGELVAECWRSDDAGTGLAEPTAAVLATSEPVLISRISAAYQEFVFRFNDNITLSAGLAYFAVIRNVDADASNTVAVDGQTTGTHAGNRAQDASGVWTATAADDLWFAAKTSPIIHLRAGELMRGITHEIVYNTESGGPFTEDETIFWGSDITYNGLSGTFTEGEYVTFKTGATLVNGGKVLRDNGTVQMMVSLENTSGNLTTGDTITGLSSGATAAINVTIVNDDKAGGEGILLALDDNGADGDLYIQLISGSAPVDLLPLEGRTSGTTAAVDTTVTTRVISPEFVGTSTGSNIIGAYGIGFATADVGSSDLFFDLSDTQRQPPNNVTMTVTGLVSGEDYILVGPRLTGALDKSQMSLSTLLNGAAEVAVVVDAIPSETPTEGNTSNTKLRVQNDDGIYRKQPYDSFTGSTFTIPSTAYNGAQGTATYQATATNDVFLAYIDVLCDATSEAFTAVYTGDRDLLLRVRDGGGTPIKTIENPITFGSSSFSTAIVRQSDA